MVQTVVFDLDGTLLDTLKDMVAAGNEICRRNGWPEHSAQAFQAMIGHGIPNLVSRFSPPEAQSPAQLEETLRQYTEYYGAHCMDLTCPYPGLQDMLERLKKDGLQMAVYSNKADNFSKELIERFFPGIFELVQGKVEGIPVKPDPTGIRGILCKLGAQAENTLLVGDSSVDVETGHNAGMAVCGVSWGFRSRESLEAAGADYLVDTAAQLESVIRGETGTDAKNVFA